MGNTLNRLLDAAEQVADATMNTTIKIMGKGKEQVDKIALQKRLAKSQQQLGKLAYVLQKTGEENPDLVNVYVKEIDGIKLALSALEPVKEPSKTVVYEEESSEDDKYAMFCGSSKQEFPTE